MKLSEMNTKELAPVLMKLTIPVSNIAMDEKTLEALKEIAAETIKVYQFGAFVKHVFPILLESHFEDTCEIIACLAGKTKEQVMNQKGLETIRDAKDVFDKDLLDFFKSSVPMEQKK